MKYHADAGLCDSVGGVCHCVALPKLQKLVGSTSHGKNIYTIIYREFSW